MSLSRSTIFSCSRRSGFGIGGSGGVTAAAAAVAAGFLKQYQVDRFMAFTNPDLDPRGAGYNTEQARIAVGNA